VRDALRFITACTIDRSCHIEPPEMVGTAPTASASDSGSLLGLKFGLAAAFLAMTVVASYLPCLFRWSSHYQVCSRSSV
jgi:hypothetical protein